MLWLKIRLSRIAALFRSEQSDRQLDEEMRCHIELMAEEYMRRGMTPKDAWRAARQSFGGVDQTKEDYRYQRGLPMIETFMQDLRYSFRVLNKTRGFSIVAILTLALGIGANTAIFSVVNGVLLRQLPYSDPVRLLTLRSNQSLPDLDDIKSQAKSFSYIGSIAVQPVDYTSGSEPEQIQAGMIDSEIFRALGVQPMMGRVITPEEDGPGAEQLVVISHRFWSNQLGGDPSVVGRSIPLSGKTYRIIGVMPAGFTMPREETDVWVSVRVMYPAVSGFRGVHILRTYLRLKQDVTINQAAAEIANIDSWLASNYPKDNTDRHSQLIRLQDRIVGRSRSTLVVLFGAVTLVLLIACTNFAGLLLARSISRSHETTIRAALGARPGRLVQQILTESVLISVLGGLAGLFLAFLGIKLLIALKPANLPRLDSINIDKWVLLFTLAVSVATGIIFGLLPAIGAGRFSTSAGLKDGGRTGTAGAGKNRIRSILVVSEIALAVVLLVGAGLLIKGFWLLRSVDIGFNQKNLTTMRIELPDARYHQPSAQNQFRRQILERLNSLPDTNAATISDLPLGDTVVTHNFIIQGRPPLAPGTEPELSTLSLSGDFVRTLGVRLLKGRDFTAEDRENGPVVGLVNESFVRRYFPNEDPIGQHIGFTGANPIAWGTIIGVINDVKLSGLNQPEEPTFFALYEQLNQPWKRWMYVVVRSNRDTATTVSQVKERLRTIDRELPITRVSTMDEVIGASVSEQRFNMLMMSIFAVVALSLATIGIYGLISYSVTQRTSEIGIRMALGAQRRNIFSLILKEVMRLVPIGLVTGLVASIGLTRFMTSLLFGVSATDKSTFAVVTIFLIATALLAGYIPARSASRIDPLSALRRE